MLLAMANPTTAHLASPPLLSTFSTIPRRRHLAAPRRGTRLAVVASFPDPGAGPVEYTPWLIAGLGNPGAKYHGTRHNVGFEMVDRIAREESIAMNTIQSKSLLGVGSIGDVPVLLVKPQSYMNYCGEAIGPLAAYYQVPLRHILVIYDETSLPNGVLRVQRKGGHGRHNGAFPHLPRLAGENEPIWGPIVVKQQRTQELCTKYCAGRYIASHKSLQNVIEHLDGCREFPRLSIGIGSPPGKMDARAFLLQKFSSEERVQIDTALEQGVDAVRTLVLKGFSGSIERFNLVQKYKFNRV